MIDHITVSVTDLEATKAFYSAILKPLGFRVVRDYPGVIVGFGDTRPYVWMKQAALSTTPQHLAFAAKDRAHVDAFHVAALAAGARDDGTPGLRKEYHPNYYAAFVIDPLNGHPIEAVCHFPVVDKKAATSKKKASAPKAKAPAKKSKAPKKTKKKTSARR